MRTRHIAAAALAAGALLIPAAAASAAGLPGLPSLSRFTVPVSATAITQISNAPDGGHGNPPTWAIDQILRVETVTRGAQLPASDCGATATVCYAYDAQLRDSGSFTTQPGAGTPNQSCTGCAGEKIRSAVTGSLTGTYDVTFDAASGSPDASLVPANHDDHGAKPNPPFTSGTWGTQFFPPGTLITNLVGGAYNWTYTVPFPRQQWIDASTNNDGSTTGPGNNITG